MACLRAKFQCYYPENDICTGRSAPFFFSFNYMCTRFLQSLSNTSPDLTSTIMLVPLSSKEITAEKKPKRVAQFISPSSNEAASGCKNWHIKGDTITQWETPLCRGRVTIWIRRGCRGQHFKTMCGCPSSIAAAAAFSTGRR